MNIRIIYEDNHLLIVEKPINLLSQGDETGDPDMLSLLKEDIKKRYNKPGNVYLGLVHRLDRPVGGVMVFAKTSKAASRLSEQVRNKSFKKTYYAVLTGIPAEKQGHLEDYLYKDERSNMVKIAKKSDRDAKLAILDYRIIGASEGLSLSEIELDTGRSHQIRVQLANMGNPLYGDQKYNKNASAGQQLALWSYKLTLTHPTTHELLTFSCIPPRKFPWTAFGIIGD